MYFSDFFTVHQTEKIRLYFVSQMETIGRCSDGRLLKFSTKNASFCIGPYRRESEGMMEGMEVSNIFYVKIVIHILVLATCTWSYHA